MRDAPGTLRPSVALGTLALTAATTVLTEVLLTRLLSVVTWYGLAFLVLSLAMVGLTAGSLRAMKATAPLKPWIGQQLVWLAGSLWLAVAAVVWVPIQFRLLELCVVVALAALPMIFGGAIVSRLLAQTALPLPTLYAVDLLSAAFGALVPLAMLEYASPQLALSFLAAVLLLVGVALSRRFWALALLLLGLVPLQVRYFKGEAIPTAQWRFERWAPLGYVTVPPFEAAAQSYLWAAGSAAPPTPGREALAMVDGMAGTPVYGFRSLEDLSVLRFDSTTVAHRLRPSGTACVIGVGGGRDLLAARLLGHERVVGLEINPGMVEMLRAVAPESPVLDVPGIEVRLGDGRELIKRLGLKCTVLQASLVDTWAATSAGAFTHSEATLYTLEAWDTFLHAVEPDGVLTFSRWYMPGKVSETARLVSLAVGAMLQRGVKEPRKHLALVSAGRVATLLLSPSPFSEEDLQRLDALEADPGVQIVLAPHRPPADPILERLLGAPSLDALAEVGRPAGLDTSAATDDRPFFFMLLGLGYLFHSSDLSVGGVITGNRQALGDLLLAFFAVLILAVVLLGRSARPLPGWRANVYFLALGAGFMIAEVALIQRMHVMLGHPTIALAVVLAALLVSMGIASALSNRLIQSRGAVRVVAIAAALLLGVLPVLIHLMSNGWFAAALSALVGLVLGALFPSGLRFVEREKGTPMALALNGVASVLGSIAAVLISVLWGIPASFAAAAAIYAVAAICAPPSWRG